jgi:hypothetical protein
VLNMFIFAFTKVEISLIMFNCISNYMLYLLVNNY